MTVTVEQVEWFRGTFEQMKDNIGEAVLGKELPIKYVLTCLLSGGHVLLEDYPGTGKTSLAKALAKTVQSTHSRIQFTPDLLPTDVTGVTIFDQRTGRFDFHPGPIFANIVLADEINRASPKTQSALLEVMEESRVTVDGTPHEVGRPFMVIATQNPIEQAGTYRLPEAQLDRFLMKISLGYPDHGATVRMLEESAVRDRSENMEPVITANAAAQMSELADTVYIDPAMLAYVAELAEATRHHGQLKLGLSPRGCLALVRTAKTWAAAAGRNHVVPDDIKDLAKPVLRHRVLLENQAQFGGVDVDDVIDRILADLVPPADRAA